MSDNGHDSNGGNGGAGPRGLFPFTLDNSVAVTGDDIELESQMPPREVQQVWLHLLTHFRVNNNRARTEFTQGYLLYLAANGSSPRNPGNRSITAGGIRYRVADVNGQVRGGLRRFARAHADEVRHLLRERPDFADKLADRYGLSHDFSELAFDFADACSNLTPDQRAIIAALKRRILLTSTPYRPNRIDVADNVSGGTMPDPPLPTNARNNGDSGHGL